MDEERAALCLSALGNPTRIRLFRLLVRAGHGGMTVGEVQRHFGAPASTLSHHIAALVKAALVRRERRGREIVCTAGYDTMDGIVAYLTEQCCAGVAGEEEAA